MNIKEKIYQHLPNPSDLEEMIGELEHWVNPSQGTVFFADKMEREELESEFQSLGEESNKLSAVLSDCLDQFYAIKQIIDSIELSQEANQ